MRIVIEIDDGQVHVGGAEDGSAAAGGGSAASGEVADSGVGAAADAGGVDAGPGPGADAESSDAPAADGGGPSASLLEEIGAAEQLDPGHDGASSEATDAGAGPNES